MHNPGLLRIQAHSQLLQDPEGVGHGRPRLPRGLAGDDPVIRVPRELITLAPHLLIKWRQEYVTEQRSHGPFECRRFPDSQDRDPPNSPVVQRWEMAPNPSRFPPEWLPLKVVLRQAGFVAMQMAVQ